MSELGREYRRRRLLQMCGGIGAVGLSGCLRFQDDETETDTAQEDTTEADSTPQGEQNEVTLSELWSDDDGADNIWSNQSKFYWNESEYAAHALSEGGVEWSRDISYNDIEDTSGESVFAIEDQYRIFGYMPSDTTKGAHFHAFDRSGEELWASGAPSDRKHNLPIGATIAEDIAVFGARQKGGELDGEQNPLVWGVNVETGETVWEIDRQTHQFAALSYIGSYSGDIYIGWGGGTKVLDRNDGSVIEAHDSWSINYAAWGGSTGQIHGETLFAFRGGANAYSIGANGVSWSYSEPYSEFERADAPPAVDNSLVVIAADEGDIRALERRSGEERWNTAITGAVRSIALSGSHVWIADRETGLTAYDRETGQLVHRSTKPMNGNGIGVAGNVILVGGETATAYQIEK